MKRRILTVDDEPHILELLKYNFEKEGYALLQAETGEDALKLLMAEDVDLVVLDLMLPGIDGYETLRRLRTGSRNANVPVIMLTAKNEEVDRVIGLEIGADDYLAKPFGIRELMARVKALLRRVDAAAPLQAEKTEMEAPADIRIDEESRVVYVRGEEVETTLKEFELLRLFGKNPKRVFTREELLEKIWGYDYLGETRTVDVHIRQLRKKIEKDEGEGEPEHIRTVRGVGYKYIP